ncbi:histone-lysine N-methyltransferase, H3 lysine-79 specific [Drosophila busckii]|uniref:histone-lysine N-methyltransferase, H3 lysine-79 specific n=1 Tax=Drosophila busckii TaxID=30019 RepID=UPI001432E1F1|nr:histone-lysine N-methyltransferase, H3 lysine-79 specific [Drosophila busckii]
MDAQFEHLCRICAANTKNKNTSVAESVFILKTAGLRDKIAKHLFLTVAEDDPLPKVLCKSCYRQVEATASLSNIAKHTQRVFRDFLLSTMPKLGPVPQVPSTQNQDTSASASVSISSKHTNSNNSNSNSNNNRSDHRRENPRIDTFQPIMLTRPPETTIIPLPPRNVNVSEKKKEEIVITLATAEIRLCDLLRLITQALKWPVTSINSEEQMSRLKNSKFSVIMSDSNLLQDNDLTQILGPYLTPIMAAVQQQQQNQSTPNAAKETSPAKSPAHEATELRLMGTDVNPCTMPYKLPPETSVQLVPSSPTEQTPQLPVSPSKSESRSSNAKRSQRKMRARGDADTSAAANTSSAARVANELLNINTTLVSQFGSNPADAINEALISILKQREKLHSQPTRRRRSSTPADTNSELNLEDIVLVETPASLETEADGDGNANVVSFKLPAQILPEPTVVTRPIIKRRKTNAQTSNQQQKDATAKTHIETTNTTTTTPTAKTEPARASTAPVERSLSMETSVNESAVEIEPQAPTSTMPESTTLKSAEQQLEDEDEATEEVAANNGEDNSLNKPAADSNRKEDVKAVLGKKLLEAIGLPQLAKNVPVETSRDTLRSALKRSLKQAQEQQQHLKRLKQEEPVKQMADSTTKPVAGESAEEHKKAIAERELELLKRKSKSMELNKTLKDDKLERTNDISSSSRNRRSRYKSKTDINDDSGAEDGRKERWDEDDDLPLRAESRLSDPGTSSNRPTRTSKTMSKYYKSPGNEKGLLSQKSQHAMGTRSTRQR